MIIDHRSYKIEPDASSENAFSIQEKGNFAYLPITCKKRGLSNKRFVTYYFYNDKRGFQALKKQKEAITEVEAHIIKYGVYTKEPLTSLKDRAKDCAKQELTKRQEEEQRKQAEKISALKILSPCVPKAISDDIFLKCYYEGHGYDSGWRLSIDIHHSYGRTELQFNLGENADYRGIWKVKSLQFPVENKHSDEINLCRIDFIENGGKIITSASEQEATLCAKASLIAYQQVNSGLYEASPFVLESCLCAQQNDTFSCFWNSAVYTLEKNTFESMKDYIREVCEDLFPGETRTVTIPVCLNDKHNSTIDAVKQAGKAGEAEVDYIIKWLTTKGFISIEKDCKNPRGDSCIALQNTEFLDEKQEFDHILVFQGGVIHIETKNYSGKIEIKPTGIWTQEKAGEHKGIESPVFQIDRHHDLLSSIVGAVPIYDIICIANKSSEILGIENCPVPVVKYDMLQRYILQNIPDTPSLDEDQIQEIVKVINCHKV